MFMQLLEIIIFAVVNMQSLNDIVKRLFIKIEIGVRVFHDRSTRMLTVTRAIGSCDVH